MVDGHDCKCAIFEYGVYEEQTRWEQCTTGFVGLAHTNMQVLWVTSRTQCGQSHADEVQEERASIQPLPSTLAGTLFGFRDDTVQCTT